MSDSTNSVRTAAEALLEAWDLDEMSFPEFDRVYIERLRTALYAEPDDEYEYRVLWKSHHREGVRMAATEEDALAAVEIYAAPPNCSAVAERRVVGEWKEIGDVE